MKAMLLAAGRGKRMRKLTENTAKPLLRVNGTSIIDFHLQKLATAGITDVVINVSWYAEKITQHVIAKYKNKLNVNFSLEPNALETAGGVANALPLLGSDPFLLISSDVWSDIDYSKLIQTKLAKLAHLVLVNNPTHHSTGDFSLDRSLVTRRQATQSLTYSGIGIYHPQLFVAARGKILPLREVLWPAIQKSRVTGHLHRGDWMDIGTPERLFTLGQMLRGTDSKAVLK